MSVDLINFSEIKNMAQWDEETIKSMKEAIEEGEKVLEDLEEKIDEARRAGINVDKLIAEYQTIKEALRLRKEVFGKYFK